MTHHPFSPPSLLSFPFDPFTYLLLSPFSLLSFPRPRLSRSPLRVPVQSLDRDPHFGPFLRVPCKFLDRDPQVAGRSDKGERKLEGADRSGEGSRQVGKGRHRRLAWRGSAATDQALRRARWAARSALDCCRMLWCCSRQVPEREPSSIKQYNSWCVAGDYLSL